MNSELEAIKDAVEAQDFDQARTLADAYVAANPGEFTDHAAKTLEECVSSVDVLRAASLDTPRWLTEAWLLHRFAPQNIGGAYQAQIRVSDIADAING